jgi:aromatic ring-opening dioxygenase LigB subunit
VGRGTGEASLPLSLTVGLWLLECHASDAPRLLFGVHAETESKRCAALGAALADRAPRVAMLVMGDGSARRSLKGPGYLDDRAQAFDEGVAAALQAVEPAALLDIDPALAGELLVAGRAAWQVLAGAAQARAAVSAPALTGDVGYAGAPYGVGYVVATWVPVAI